MGRRLVLKGSWDEVCKMALEYAEECRRRYGIRLTLRALFYWLADAQGVIVHSQIAYKKLSERFARFRERCGKIDVLRDDTRQIREYYQFEVVDIRAWLEREIMDMLSGLESVARLPRWYGQKYYVCILIEKESITLIDEIAYEQGVDALPTRGFSSITTMWEMAGRAWWADIHRKIPVFLILTDFDPSGLFIDKDYRKKLTEYMEMRSGPVPREMIFKKIAMLPEQIEKYGLPAIPHDDPKAERIRRDPRYPAWLRYCKEHRIEAQVIELDAFAGIEPAKFREHIIHCINEYFDEDIARRWKEEEERRVKEAIKLKKILEERLKDFISY